MANCCFGGSDAQLQRAAVSGTRAQPPWQGAFVSGERGSAARSHRVERQKELLIIGLIITTTIVFDATALLTSLPPPNAGHRVVGRRFGACAARIAVKASLLLAPRPHAREHGRLLGDRSWARRHYPVHR